MDNLLRNFKPNVSEQTIKTYINSIDMVLKMVDASNNSILYDTKKILLALKDKNKNTQKTRIASIIVLLQAMKNKRNTKKTDKALLEYSSHIDFLKTSLNSELELNEKNEKQKEKWMSKDDIKLISETLLKKIPATIRTQSDLNSFRDYIIWEIYMSIPTRNDLIYSKIIMKPKNVNTLSHDSNYILLDKAKREVSYVRNVSKTSRSELVKTFKLNPDLYQVLLEYKKNVYKFNNPDKLLILGDKGEKISANRFGVIFSNITKRILGRRIGTTMIRHIGASEDIKINDLKEKAERQGHSVDMHIEYAKKD
jgi:hypothetical protein